MTTLYVLLYILLALSVVAALYGVVARSKMIAGLGIVLLVILLLLLLSLYLSAGTVLIGASQLSEGI